MGSFVRVGKAQNSASFLEIHDGKAYEARRKVFDRVIGYGRISGSSAV